MWFPLSPRCYGGCWLIVNAGRENCEHANARYDKRDKLNQFSIHASYLLPNN